MRKLALLATALVLTGCSSGAPSQSATTTTTAPPDPAATACRQLDTNVENRPKENPALDQLTLSRDSRVVAAARQVEQILQDRELNDTVPPDLDLDYANAVLELVRACKTAGYL